MCSSVIADIGTYIAAEYPAKYAATIKRCVNHCPMWVLNRKCNRRLSFQWCMSMRDTYARALSDISRRNARPQLYISSSAINIATHCIFWFQWMTNEKYVIMFHDSMNLHQIPLWTRILANYGQTNMYRTISCLLYSIRAGTNQYLHLCYSEHTVLLNWNRHNFNATRKTSKKDHISFFHLNQINVLWWVIDIPLSVVVPIALYPVVQPSSVAEEYHWVFYVYLHQPLSGSIWKKTCTALMFIWCRRNNMKESSTNSEKQLMQYTATVWECWRVWITSTVVESNKNNKLQRVQIGVNNKQRADTSKTIEARQRCSTSKETSNHLWQLR